MNGRMWEESPIARSYRWQRTGSADFVLPQEAEPQPPADPVRQMADAPDIGHVASGDVAIDSLDEQPSD
jgi:hypothetical protein